MTHESILTDGWQTVTDRLGGAAGLEKSARETGAFRRGRGVKTPVVLLRLILAYCLGENGLRLTAAWAASMGLADISNVALLYRLRCCGDWLSALVGQALAANCPQRAQGRLIRIVDATAVPKAGRKVAVGTRIAPRPPHRSRRALLTHRAPPLGSGVEAV
jgi:hypothetical protein